jgi:hypothetical protein
VSASAPPAAPPRQQLEHLQVQRLVCTVLIGASERALFDLRCRIGRALQPEDVRIGLGATALLEEMLTSWREALAAVDGARAAAADDPPTLSPR